MAEITQSHNEKILKYDLIEHQEVKFTYSPPINEQLDSNASVRYTFGEIPNITDDLWVITLPKSNGINRE